MLLLTTVLRYIPTLSISPSLSLEPMVIYYSFSIIITADFFWWGSISFIRFPINSKQNYFKNILKVIQLLVYDVAVAVAVAVIKVMRCCNSSRKKDQSLVSNQLFFPSFVAIFIFRCFQLLLQYSTFCWILNPRLINMILHYSR